jgi:hypothetical protein
MHDLKDALNVLYELNELRDRAKELREQGRRSLKAIEDTGLSQRDTGELIVKNKAQIGRWISSNNRVEIALLVKVRNHRDLSVDDNENDKSEAPPALKNKLKTLKLDDLFPPTGGDLQQHGGDGKDRSVSVLEAARTMQALVMRSETVFSKATMLCYYRIVRELYMAAQPDWTIGAARAGVGGSTSAFITGECIRAIFAFEAALRRTAVFFKQTSRLHGRYELLKGMLGLLKIEPAQGDDATAGRPRGADASETPAPLEWANKAIERMWFDWYISTNPRHGNMGLHLGPDVENQLLFNPQKPVDMKSAGDYLGALQGKLREAAAAARATIGEARREIEDFRNYKQGNFFEWKMEGVNVTRRPNRDIYRGSLSEEQLSEYGNKLRDYDRTESAHKFALSLIEKAESEINKVVSIVEKKPLKDVLEELEKHFQENANRIHRVLEPAKRYIRTVLNRELASAAFGRFDAGEMVFAAASFGAITNWKSSELLTRACDLLVEALPESGRLLTTRPFHSNEQGHRMLPIGCEMTRSLAQLLQRTNYDIEPKLVRRMLNIFEEKPIRFDSLGPGDGGQQIAWNFEGSPDPNRPSVWVTAVSVLAIDRVVRMLNERINSIIFKHFEVIRPEKPHSDLTLNDLIYPDQGLSKYHRPARPSMALRLEQMRAHVMRVKLPEVYKDERGRKERVFSAIFYGPPGTGKTALVEALALSSHVPLIRLSPSDLVVRGPAEIEGRARTVFEALSMLTQVVIILDEFEVVVGRRGQSEEEEEKKEVEIYEFLRTGMLPKLLKLHDSARKQSLAYCLATNFLMKIDPAARRKGRFDFLIPVYDPDALSRAGTFLYRLWRVALKLERDGSFNPEENGLRRRFIEVIEMTSDTRAGSLAVDYFRLPEWAEYHTLDRPDNFYEEIPFFWYVLNGEDKGYAKKKRLLEEEKQKTRDEQYAPPTSGVEADESRWLETYERQLTTRLWETEGGDDILACLIGPEEVAPPDEEPGRAEPLGPEPENPNRA